MLIKLSESDPIEPSEITPEAIYADRRRFLVMMGLATAAVAFAGFELPQRGLRPSSSRVSSVEEARACGRRTGCGVRGHYALEQLVRIRQW